MALEQLLGYGRRLALGAALGLAVYGCGGKEEDMKEWTCEEIGKYDSDCWIEQAEGTEDDRAQDQPRIIDDCNYLQGIEGCQEVVDLFIECVYKTCTANGEPWCETAENNDLKVCEIIPQPCVSDSNQVRCYLNRCVDLIDHSDVWHYLVPSCPKRY